MTYEDLNISDIKGNPPVTTCNVCGQKNKINFNGTHPEDRDIMIFICSEKCKAMLNKLFETRPEQVLNYLAELFRNVQEVKNND